MANVDKPYGALAVKHLYGGRILASMFTAGGELFGGDFVLDNLDGNPRIATAGADVFGATLNYAASAAEVHVYEDPGIIFMCQASGTVAKIDMFSSADVVIGTGVAKTGRSQHEVNATADTTHGLLILDKVDRLDNAWGANVDLLVVIHEHLRQQAGSGGV